jgi:hypothetical protein
MQQISLQDQELNIDVDFGLSFLPFDPFYQLHLKLRWMKHLKFGKSLNLHSLQEILLKGVKIPEFGWSVVYRRGSCVSNKKITEKFNGDFRVSEKIKYPRERSYSGWIYSVRNCPAKSGTKSGISRILILRIG